MTDQGPSGRDSSTPLPDGLPATEADLLAYVEDQLDAASRDEFEARLADRPDVLAALRGMANDRAVLRSARQPALPHDFLEELEPSVARPMLYVTPDPKRLGSYRRRQRRARRARSVRRYAVAAAVLVGLSAVVWSAYLVVSMSGGSSTGQLRADNQPVDPDRDAVAVTQPVDDAPSNESEMLAAAGDNAPSFSPEELNSASADSPAPRIAAAPVELDVRIDLRPLASSDAPLTIADCEARLVAHLTALGHEALARNEAGAIALQPAPPAGQPPVALVRNFNEAEARSILTRIWSARRAEERPPAVAGLLDSEVPDHRSPRSRLRSLANALRSTAEAITADQDQHVLQGRQIFGPASLSPDYARQLDCSAAGATHVVTLPLADLSRLLDRLYADEAMTAEFVAVEQPMDGEPVAEADAPAMANWAERLRLLRNAISEVQRAYGDNVLIAVPVAIDAPTGEND